MTEPNHGRGRYIGDCKIEGCTYESRLVLCCFSVPCMMTISDKTIIVTYDLLVELPDRS